MLFSYLSFAEKRTIPDYHDPAQVCGGEVSVDHDKCTGCKLCFKACPADVLLWKDKKPNMRSEGINECVLCGACIAICPENAITAVRAQRYTGYYKTIDRGELIQPRV